MQTLTLHSFHRKKGATLIEIMAMLLVLSLALMTFFYTITQTISFSQDTEARVKAISLAREGVEALTNIRNTNWLRFSSDRKLCWDTLNYNSACIGNSSANKITNGDYILYSENGLWKLDNNHSTTWNWNNFSKYQLHINHSGSYVAGKNFSTSHICQNIANNNHTLNCKSQFARVISIGNKSATGLTVTSTVYWRNSYGERKVKLTSNLSNWKSLYD